MSDKMNDEAQVVEQTPEQTEGLQVENLPQHMRVYFEQLFAKSASSMLVAVDATFPGVEGLPKRHAYTVNLKLRFEMTKRGGPTFGEDALVQDLGFQGNWHTVTVPYKAIWYIWTKDDSLLLTKHLTVGALAAIGQLLMVADIGLQPGELKDELDAKRANRSHLKPV